MVSPSARRLLEQAGDDLAALDLLAVRAANAVSEWVGASHEMTSLLGIDCDGEMECLLMDEVWPLVLERIDEDKLDQIQAAIERTDG